jgi:hypothetical protein
MSTILHSKEEVNPNELCWLEARFDNIPNAISEYPKKFGKSRLSFHITIYYGYDVKFSKDIIEKVMNSIPLEVVTGIVKKGKTRVIWLEIISEELQRIFLDLYGVYPKKYSNIRGNEKMEEKFCPHITLMRLSKKEFAKFHIFDPCLLLGQKITINKFLSCQHDKLGNTIIIDSVEVK